MRKLPYENYELGNIQLHLGDSAQPPIPARTTTFNIGVHKAIQELRNQRFRIYVQRMGVVNVLT
jgi:hypothetical protein